MNAFILAWQFLTILPLKKTGENTGPRIFGQSMAYYPAVGFLLGMILWGAGWIGSAIFPRPVIDGLVISFLVVLTGAFHLDGLADTLDGLAFGKSPEKRLQIAAATVIVSGEVHGNISASQRVELLETGVINGDVKAAVLTVAAGSRMRGNADFGWADKGPGSK